MKYSGILSLLIIVLFPLHATADLRDFYQGLQGTPLQGNIFDCNSACGNACLYLSKEFENQISFPSIAVSHVPTPHYWAKQQDEVKPCCYFMPLSSEDVARALLVVKKTSCPFAVKSGGHASFKGASNVPAGITIDLVHFNRIEVSNDRRTTSVGSGSRWIDVYRLLEPQGLSVAGGRAAHVGVGGLTLGGGISFFSGRSGWAIDGVTNFEVVIANGSIANISQKSDRELYWALRGGSSNFGIVTRFDFDTFPYDMVWGGAKSWHIEANVSLLHAFENFNRDSPKDLDAVHWLVFSYMKEQDKYFASAIFVHVGGVPDPPIFDEYKAIPPRGSSMRMTDVSDLSLEMDIGSRPGFRQHYITATFHNSAKLQSIILDIFVQEIDSIKHKLSNFFRPSLMFQTITNDVISHFSQNGGNALGISKDEGPLTMMAVQTQWSEARDDETIYCFSRRIVERSMEEAKRMKLHHRYMYMNYAAPEQDVFEGYEEENKKKLLDIQRKYDPEGLFVDLQPGYFRLRE